LYGNRSSRRRFLLGLGLVVICVSSLRAERSLRKVTYAVATADLNIGYPYATLPRALSYFEQEGLDVDVVPGQSSATIVQLLLSGRADVGLAQPDPVVIQRVHNKLPLVSFYAVCRRGTNRFIVNPDAPIQSVHDLKGKTVGVNDLGSGGVTFLRARLKEAGMTVKDVQLISVGYGTPSFEALKNKTVDAEVSFTGGIARQRMAGYAVRVLPTTEDEMDQYSFNLFATQSFITNNPDVIAKIGRATAKATVFLMTNPDAAVRVFWKQYPDRAPKDPNDPKALQNDLAIIESQIRDMAADQLPVDFEWGANKAGYLERLSRTWPMPDRSPAPLPQRISSRMPLRNNTISSITS